jgi:hypothetical protein
MKANTLPLGTYTVKQLPRGEFVSRTKADGSAYNKVYVIAGYDRSEKKYQLDDVEDISRCVYVSGTAKVIAGFTY